jgi:uncharacterized protein YndB with AHSA1/START domain
MIDGTYRVTESGEHEVRFDRRYGQPTGKVWAALTEPKVLANWLGDIEIEPRVGGKYIIHFRAPETVVMTGTITAFEPERLLAYTWLENYGMPQSHIRWELSPDGAGCRLILTHRYPPGCERKDILPFLGGWHAFLDAIERASRGEFVPYQDEKPIAAQYREKYG